MHTHFVVWDIRCVRQARLCSPTTNKHGFVIFSTLEGLSNHYIGTFPVAELERIQCLKLRWKLILYLPKTTSCNDLLYVLQQEIPVSKERCRKNEC